MIINLNSSLESRWTEVLTLRECLYLDSGEYVDQPSCLVTNVMDNVLCVMPSLDNIQANVFNLSKDRSSGPYGFGGLFYQTY